MKAVLISIRPEWVEKIAGGKKTIELRKTRPRNDPPFKCYIYRTKCGGVVGEFICDRIISMSVKYNHMERAEKGFAFYDDTCLTDKQIIDYLGNGVIGYGWHISRLKIYDEPKPLSGFFGKCDKPVLFDCSFCHEYGTKSCKQLTRPPQSWCYVEEL